MNVKASSKSTVVSVGDQDTCTSSTPTEEHWIDCGGVHLMRKHLQQILKGAELSDLHISAFQNLLKQKFPHLGGLQSPLYQEKTPLKLADQSTTLQVIHTRSSHWAALQVCGGTGGDVCLYDSAYTGMVTHTLKVIAQLIRSSDSSIRVQLMNTSKQTGSADCGLYALATLTCIAFDIDPVTVILISSN